MLFVEVSFKQCTLHKITVTLFIYLLILSFVWRLVKVVLKIKSIFFFFVAYEELTLLNPCIPGWKTIFHVHRTPSRVLSQSREGYPTPSDADWASSVHSYVVHLKEEWGVLSHAHEELLKIAMVLFSSLFPVMALFFFIYKCINLFCMSSLPLKWLFVSLPEKLIFPIYSLVKAACLLPPD